MCHIKKIKNSIKIENIKKIPFENIGYISDIYP